MMAGAEIKKRFLISESRALGKQFLNRALGWIQTQRRSRKIKFRTRLKAVKLHANNGDIQMNVRKIGPLGYNRVIEQPHLGCRPYNYQSCLHSSWGTPVENHHPCLFVDYFVGMPRASFGNRSKGHAALVFRSPGGQWADGKDYGKDYCLLS